MKYDGQLLIAWSRATRERAIELAEEALALEAQHDQIVDHSRKREMARELRIPIEELELWQK